MYSDNQACIQIAHDTGNSGRAKHIELRFLAIQDVVRREQIDEQYFNSEENQADIFTKPFKHMRIVKRLTVFL